nr:MAG TPA: hypothetical protein [Caudoviricetes sp.]
MEESFLGFTVSTILVSFLSVFRLVNCHKANEKG